MYHLTVIDPATSLVEVYSTDPVFQPHPPKRAYFIESRSERDGGVIVPGWIVKNLRMLMKFADAIFVSEPVVTARLEGSGWAYDAID